MLHPGIDALYRLREASEVPPEVIAVDVLVVPMPRLSAPGGTGEERRENFVVKKHPLSVLCVKIAWSRVVRLYRTNLRKNCRAA